MAKSLLGGPLVAAAPPDQPVFLRPDPRYADLLHTWIGDLVTLLTCRRQSAAAASQPVSWATGSGWTRRAQRTVVSGRSSVINN